MADLDLKLALSTGIPEAFTATMNYATTLRETMDPDLRRGFDEINLWLAQWFWGLFGFKPKETP